MWLWRVVTQEPGKPGRVFQMVVSTMLGRMESRLNMHDCRVSKKDGVRVGDERTDKLQSRERPKGREKKFDAVGVQQELGCWADGCTGRCKCTFAAGSRVVASSRFDRSRVWFGNGRKMAWLSYPRFFPPFAGVGMYV